MPSRLPQWATLSWLSFLFQTLKLTFLFNFSPTTLNYHSTQFHYIMFIQGLYPKPCTCLPRVAVIMLTHEPLVCHLSIVDSSLHTRPCCSLSNNSLNRALIMKPPSRWSSTPWPQPPANECWHKSNAEPTYSSQNYQVRLHLVRSIPLLSSWLQIIPSAAPEVNYASDSSTLNLPLPPSTIFAFLLPFVGWLFAFLIILPRQSPTFSRTVVAAATNKSSQ